MYHPDEHIFLDVLHVCITGAVANLLLSRKVLVQSQGFGFNRI